MRLRDVDSPTARVQALVAIVVCVVLPAGSYLHGSAIFAWNMFSKSETYRMSIIETSADGTRRELDPRAIKHFVNPSMGYFLPPPSAWRHDPVGYTFRTGLPAVAALACRIGRGARRIEVTLDERATLDATPTTTHAGTECR